MSIPSSIGSTVAALLEAAEHPEYEVRLEAVSALAGSAAEPEARRVLRLKMSDFSYELGRLPAFPVGDAALREALLEKVAHPAPDVRQAAVSALAAHAAADREVLAALLERLDDSSVIVRLAAVESLGPWAAGHEEIRFGLLARLADERAKVRLEAIQACAALASRHSDVRAALRKAALEEDDFLLRRAAIAALDGTLATGPKRRAGNLGARRALVKNLEDPESGVRKSAIEAFAPLAARDSRIRRRLIEMYEGETFYLRLEIIRGLAPLFATDQLPADMRETIFHWLQFDPEYELFGFPFFRHFRESLATAIAPCLPASDEFRRQIAAWLDSPRRAARLGALAALLAWPGGPPAEFRQRLVTFLDDRRDLRSYQLRLAAAAPLLNYSETCREAIEVCLEALEYRELPWESLGGLEALVRHEAARLLSRRCGWPPAAPTPPPGDAAGGGTSP